MNIAVYTLIGSIILLVVRILSRHGRREDDPGITNGRFEKLKAHEQEAIKRGRLSSTH